MADESLQTLEELEKLEKEEEKKKKELAKLKQKIKDATEQLKDRKEFEEKVPIEEVTADDPSALSEEGKKIFEAVRGKSSKSKEKSDSKEDSSEKDDDLEDRTTKKRDSNLEGAVDYEMLGKNFDHMPRENELSFAYQQQIREQSRRPITELYSEMKSIYDTSINEGYVAAPTAEKAVELQSAIERKLADVEAGNYHFTSEETAKAASVALELKDKVSAMYVSGKDHKQSDLYK